MRSYWGKNPAILYVVLGVVLACLSCTREKEPGKESRLPTSEASTEDLAHPIEVKSYTIVAREIPVVINTSGKTLASDSYELKAPSETKIQKVFIEEGSKVQSGDPLVTFDDEENRLRLAKAKADLRESEVAINNLSYLMKNREALQQAGKMSDEEAGGLELQMTFRQAAMERAKTEIDLYDKLGQKSQVTSPLAGTVVKKNVSEGAQVYESQALLTVERFDPIYFAIKASEDQVAYIDRNSDISIRFPTLPEQLFKGELVGVNALDNGAGDSASMMEVRIKISNPDLTLKKDLRGDVVIQTQGKKKVFPVPETAFLKTEHSVYVYKIKPDHTVKKVPVDLGDPISNQSIVNKGIVEGDEIVLVQNPQLKDGMMVDVQRSTH